MSIEYKLATFWDDCPEPWKNFTNTVKELKTVPIGLHYEEETQLRTSIINKELGRYHATYTGATTENTMVTFESGPDLLLFLLKWS